MLYSILMVFMVIATGNIAALIDMLMQPDFPGWQMRFHVLVIVLSLFAGFMSVLRIFDEQKNRV